MAETTDKATEKKCETPATTEHVAAEALACTFDPKHAGEDTAQAVLAPVEIVDTEAEAQVQQSADLVREELTGNWAWQSPDAEKLSNILSGMTVQGRQELIARYDQGESKFWDDAKYYLTEGSPEYAAIEVLMNAKAATGDAGNARVAMSTLSDDPEKGMNLLRAVVSGKRSTQIATLNQDYKEAFGTTLAEAIQDLDESVVSPQTKAIFDILLQGSDKIGREQIVAMANLAVEGGDSRMLINLLAGDDDKDIYARADLLADEKFMKDATSKFPGVEIDQNGQMVMVLDQEVSAALRKGKIALDAVLTGDAQGIHGNLENTSVTFANAPEQDRQAFRVGREIVESGREPATAVEKEAVRKYTDLVKAMNDVSLAQRAVLEDELLHGERTLISDIARTYSEGTLGFGKGFYNHDALAAVENMTAREYGLLRNPEYKKEFDRQIAAMITDEALRNSVMEMVNAKLNVEVKTTDSNPAGYTDSLSVRRSLDQFMTDLAASGTYNADKQIVDRLSNLTPEEAQRYSSSPEFKRQVDGFVSRYVSEPNAEALVNLQLASAGKEKTTTQVKLEQFLRGQMQPAPATTDFQGQAQRELKEISQVEELMKDPELQARMKLVDEQIRQRQNGELVGEINAQDELLYSIFNNAIPSDSKAFAIGAGTFDTPGVGLGMMPEMQSNFQRLLNDGEVPFNTKIGLSRVLPGDWLAGRYEDVARLSESERAKLRLTPEQQQLVDNAVRNGGTLDLAGRFREYAVEGGNIAPLMEEYSKLPEEKRRELDRAYRSEFGTERDLLAEARASLGKSDLSEAAQKVWERVIENKGDLQLVDRLQLFVTGSSEGAKYSDFRAELSKLTPRQAFDLKKLYSSEYKGNLDDKFLDTVPAKDIDRYSDYLSLGEVDGVDAFFKRMARFEKLGTFDGSPEAHERMLQINENILRRFNDQMVKLPEEAQDAMAEYYSKVYQNNLDSNEKYAHFVADMTITAATIAAAIALTPATGGVSLGMVTAYATAGGTARVAMIAEMQGGTFDSSPENMLKLGLVGAVEGAMGVPLSLGKVVTAAAVVDRKVIEEGAETLAGQVVDDAAETVAQVLPVPVVVEETTEKVAQVLPAPSTVVEATSENLVRAADKPAVQANVQTVDEALPVPEVIANDGVLQPVDIAASVVEEARKFDIPETGFVDLGNMIKNAAPEDRVALVKEALAKHPDVAIGSWMRLIEPSEMETFLRAANELDPKYTLDWADHLVDVRNLRPAQGAGPIDFAAWEQAIAKVRAEISAPAESLPAAVVQQGDLAVVGEKEGLEATAAAKRAPAAFPVEEAVIDDATFAGIKVADEPVAEVAALNAGRQVADDVVDDAARLTKMEEDVAAGRLTRAEVETAANNGDTVAQRMLATLRQKEAQAAVVERQAVTAQAFEDARLNAWKSFSASRLIQPAVAPMVVSEVADKLTEVAPVPEPVQPAVPLPSDALIELATVKRGEGPWQSAERILAADGKPHGVDEVRALTKAFQAVFKAENGGNGDMGGLKVRHNFVTKDNFDDLIAACNNAEVKAILLNMAQGAPVS
ncbi:MAG: hypothetical protein C0469_01430 [Cyanobacteria bacterium DS2.3.42]|nr:hypothetical protein [Cyanobacteria bacterium DS2.3.42]